MMFWLKRLREDEPDANAWALSFGDLMSLLLVVFIMLAAMSELGSAERFEGVRNSVRAAFGFPGADLASESPDAAKGLLERLRESEPTGIASWTGAKDGACEMITEEDGVTFRISGDVAFDRHRAILRQQAVELLTDLAAELNPGTAVVEVRAHAADGPADERTPFRDAFDLSYQRAHAVVDLLQRAGVAPERLRLTACGGNAPIAETGRRSPDDNADRRIEITVHAVPAKTQLADVSNKGMNGNG